ncbi:hypothetical protein SDC9_169604 [bioreactor metagenome]|uniref:Uncharacterized protein n=1 Tax=bioreactor metagenome TaxID=1076179 RepID=A0A645G5R8_9ZZZZ
MVICGTQKVKADILEVIQDGVRRVEGVGRLLFCFLFGISGILAGDGGLKIAAHEVYRAELVGYALKTARKIIGVGRLVIRAADLRGHNHNIPDGADGDERRGWFRRCGRLRRWGDGRRCRCGRRLRARGSRLRCALWRGAAEQDEEQAKRCEQRKEDSFHDDGSPMGRRGKGGCI